MARQFEQTQAKSVDTQASQGALADLFPRAAQAVNQAEKARYTRLSAEQLQRATAFFQVFSQKTLTPFLEQHNIPASAIASLGVGLAQSWNSGFAYRDIQKRLTACAPEQREHTAQILFVQAVAAVLTEAKNNAYLSLFATGSLSYNEKATQAAGQLTAAIEALAAQGFTDFETLTTQAFRAYQEQTTQKTTQLNHPLTPSDLVKAFLPHVLQALNTSWDHRSRTTTRPNGETTSVLSHQEQTAVNQAEARLHRVAAHQASDLTAAEVAYQKAVDAQEALRAHAQATVQERYSDLSAPEATVQAKARLDINDVKEAWEATQQQVVAARATAINETLARRKVDIVEAVARPVSPSAAVNPEHVIEIGKSQAQARPAPSAAQPDIVDGEFREI